MNGGIPAVTPSAPAAGVDIRVGGVVSLLAAVDTISVRVIWGPGDGVWAAVDVVVDSGVADAVAVGRAVGVPVEVGVTVGA